MEVIHAQIILGVVGALIMLVIGESLARAFGIVGAAGLIRYRASIRDPKDAGVMLATLGVGLASGVGLYLLAAAGTLFLLVVLWLIESRPQKAQILYRLRVGACDPFGLQPQVESIFRNHHVPYELRIVTANELDYNAKLPIDKTRDAILSDLRHLESTGDASFKWELRKVG